MKRILLSFLTLASLIGCQKDDITVEKNDSVKWDIDKAIEDDDIRNRIGYDPRYQYAIPTVSDIVVPMSSLEGFTITGENKREVEIKLSKVSANDAKVTLAYDATLFDKVRSQYPGYSLWQESLVQITAAEKTIAAGTRSTTFEVKVTNRANFTDKFIVPLAVKTSGNEFVKTLDGRDYVLVRIYPETITFAFEKSNITKEATLENGVAEMTNADKVVNVKVTASTAIPTTISLGLVRDNSLAGGKTLLPNGAEGTINKIDFKDKRTATISFTLQNISQLTAEGEYVLPLKLMAYDASGTAHQVSTTPVLVTVEVSDNAIPEDNEIEEIDSYSGALINRNNYSFSTNYAAGHIEKMHDGNYGGNPWWIDTTIDEESEDSAYVKATFNAETRINGIKITQNTPEKRIDFVSIYVIDNAGNYIPQGNYTTSGSRPRELFIKFKKPIKASKLYLAYFRNSGDRYIDIHEMEFF